MLGKFYDQMKAKLTTRKREEILLVNQMKRAGIEQNLKKLSINFLDERKLWYEELQISIDNLICLKWINKHNLVLNFERYVKIHKILLK